MFSRICVPNLMLLRNLSRFFPSLTALIVVFSMLQTSGKQTPNMPFLTRKDASAEKGYSS